jgi:transmembrane sensor
MRTWKEFDPTVLSPRLDEERLAREYEVLRERTLGRAVRGRPGRGARARWAVAIAAAAVVVALLVFVRRVRFSTPKLTDPAVLVAGPSEKAVRVALPDGSSVVLEPNTQARVTTLQPKAVRIDVETGSLDIEATHADGRTFVVGAGPYEVHVTGTRFRVERVPGERVSVRVAQGSVEVTSQGDKPRRLGAGEQWSAPDRDVAAAPAPEPVASSLDVPSASTPATPPPAAASAAPTDARRDAANELFEEGQRARREGRALDAARAFDKVRRTYRRDPHAALAAFELGRLRLGPLADPVGAEDALHDAIVLDPESPLREDAEALRVEALSRAGDRAGCMAARAEYRAHWPSGAYSRTVELYCNQ